MQLNEGTKNENKGIQRGDVGYLEWGDLSRLVKAPRHSLIIGTCDPKYTIPIWRAEKLVSAGLATLKMKKQLLVPTELGSAMVSANGLES